MTSRPAGSRRHLASSPFKPEPVVEAEVYEVGDRVCHDADGLGRVSNVEPAAVTVDFGSHVRRIVSPFHKMSKL
jgi:hypothetical protein